MRIVQVVHGFPPNQVGSIEEYTREISRRLAKSNEVHVYSRDSNAFNPRYSEIAEEIEGVHVRRLNNPFTICNYRRYEDRAVTRKFRDLIRDTKPDLIHVQHLWGLSASILSASSEASIPVVMTLHDYWLICRRMSLLRPDLQLCSGPGAKKCLDCRLMELRRFRVTELARKALRLVPDELWDEASIALATQMLNTSSSKLLETILEHSSRTRYLSEIAKTVNHFIAPSEFVRDTYGAFGFPSRSIIVRPHGVNTSQFTNLVKSRSNKVRFAFIGSVDEHKGLHVLVQAFNILVGKDAELNVWGATPAPRYLEELKQINKNPNLKFMGFHKDPASIFRQTDVLVVPSIMYETFSLVAREALLTGTPVIASDLGALSEAVIEGGTGFLFPRNNPIALARCMTRFVENRELLTQMKTNLPSVRSMDEHVQELESIYEGMIHP